jgi:hypothetical protein
VNPNNEKIKKFLSVFDKLVTFEYEHRVRCGWGVWNENAPSERLPIPEVMEVYNWLKSEVASKEDSKDVLE